MHEGEAPTPSSSFLKRRAPDIASDERHRDHTGVDYNISADNHLLVFTDKSLRHSEFELDYQRISFLGEKVGPGMRMGHPTVGTTTDASV